MSVLAKWYPAVVVWLLQEEVGTNRMERAAHRMQALLTNVRQRRWEWQENRRDAWVPGFFKYQTAFVATLDVRTAFDVATPSVVSRILTCMGGGSVLWRR